MGDWIKKLSLSVMAMSLLGQPLALQGQTDEQWAELLVQQVQSGLQTAGGAGLMIAGGMTAALAAAMWIGACFTSLSAQLCPEPWTQVKAVSTCALGLVAVWLGWQLLNRRQKVF